MPATICILIYTKSIERNNAQNYKHFQKLKQFLKEYEMKKSVIIATILTIGSAQANSLDLRCSKQIMIINGVQKDVHVSMYNDYPKHPSRYQLSITTKPANSPSYRSNPTPSDPIKFQDLITITTKNGDLTEFMTDNKVDGYRISASGDLFPSSSKDPCSSPVTLRIQSFGNPSLIASGSYSCSAVCNW